MILASFIELIAKIKQKNNGTFKLVDAQDVECDDGKGLDEVLNEKLDKNLGAENTNKVLVTDADGNVTTQNKEDFEGGGTTDYNGLTNKPSINGIELSGNKTSSDLKMYTQEEVDYLLNDKMDKPYYDIAITDDTTIENTLDGNFKIDSIEGSVYQAEESGIVPTPERPIPIRSKKIKVGEEYVELRSLKEATNLFDLEYGKLLFGTEKTSTTGGKVVNDGTSVTIENMYDTSILKVARIYLKSGVRYTCKYERNSEIIEGTEQGSAATLLGIMKEDKVITQISNNNSYTPNESGYYEFYFYGGVGYKVTYSNIMLVEGTSAPSSYVAPTVRDYKIVDHVTKTSKIVRNVLEIDANNIKAMLHTSNEKYISFQLNTSGIDASMLPQGKIGYCSLFLTKSWDGLKDYEMVWIATASMGISISKDRNISNVEQFLQFIKEKDIKIFAKSTTPTEESIPYVETDISEVGYSWQDSTSPSPDIKSEIYKVDEINIKLVNKNLLNIEEMKKQENYLESSYGYKVFPINVETGKSYTFNRNLSNGYGLNLGNAGFKGEQFGTISPFIINNTISSSNISKYTLTAKNSVIYFAVDGTAFNNLEELFDTCFFETQFEEGTESTNYEPYQETSIQHTLSKPLRATKDGSIKDTIDIVNSEVTYNITDFTVDGNTTIALGTDKEKTRVIQINNQPFLNPTNNLKMYCDKLLNDSGKDEELFTVNTALFIGIDKNRVEANDINAFKKWFGENPLYFIGISKTPTTEPLEDELVQKLKTLKTFSPVTHVFITGIAKPKLNAKYPKDIASAQAQLEQKVITLQEAVIKNV